MSTPEPERSRETSSSEESHSEERSGHRPQYSKYNIRLNVLTYPFYVKNETVQLISNSFMLLSAQYQIKSAIWHSNTFIFRSFNSREDHRDDETIVGQIPSSDRVD